MKKVIKIISFLLCFTVLFLGLQFAFDLVNGAWKSACGFYKLENNSVDALFLGSSQMLLGVNAQKMYEEYGIRAYDFGAYGQRLATSYYYLQEAFKTQSPKIVAVEVSGVFWSDDVGEANLALNYPLMPLSKEKYASLKWLLEDPWQSAWRCIPFLISHSMWCQTTPIRLVKGVYQ